ncbi:conserved protein of unknown function [Rhodovastum atsumiense]|uniref:Uncharacterized protein n=1 Tax=Rhodovastum atsumiense TaxID=504468 RepID=A0A5M6IIC5_9PROT|nr:hypothetical protein [Rhodovastum atsumiense]KAA5608026.1 hypothetical protein F1189_30980 [Rhodovastum atsumiense]CAH2604987.1 conserved protein of unknown function [Rhodovastum atsumiense]
MRLILISNTKQEAALYAYLDQKVNDLALRDRFLLNVTRVWVLARTLGGDPRQPLTPRFARFGVGEALEDFDAAMTLLDRSSRETLRFERPCALRVEEAEAVLLATWEALGRGEAAQARRVLEHLAGTEAGHILRHMLAVTEWLRMLSPTRISRPAGETS